MTKQISIKLPEKIYDELQMKAQKTNHTVSDVVRECIESKEKDGWIRKKDLIEQLTHMFAILNEDEIKDKRTTRRIKKEVKKLWEMVKK